MLPSVTGWNIQILWELANQEFRKKVTRPLTGKCRLFTRKTTVFIFLLPLDLQTDLFAFNHQVCKEVGFLSQALNLLIGVLGYRDVYPDEPRSF